MEGASCAARATWVAPEGCTTDISGVDRYTPCVAAHLDRPTALYSGGALPCPRPPRCRRCPRDPNGDALRPGGCTVQRIGGRADLRGEGPGRRKATAGSHR